MRENDLLPAWEYHNSTKHSYRSVREDHHYLDWNNYPNPFKIYPDLEPIPLPRELPHTGIPVVLAVSAPSEEVAVPSAPDLGSLARILFYSAGVTRKKRYWGGEFYFRAYACAGALYPNEVYIVCEDLPDLPAGVYHFGPGDFALRRLRAGDYRGSLIRATASRSSVAQASVVLVLTAIFWRSAWKYRARCYRHCFWDAGMILANLLSLAASGEIPAEVVIGFNDAEVNHLLGLEAEREAALCLIPLGLTLRPAVSAPQEIPALKLRTVPVSKEQVDYPAIRQIHHASSISNEAEVGSFRGPGSAYQEQPPSGNLFPLSCPEESELPRTALEDVIMRRGSTRQFTRSSISFSQLSTIMERATRGLRADFLSPTQDRLQDVYVIANAVDGLPIGAYYFRSGEKRLELLKEGSFRDRAGYICLEQELAADAAAGVFFLSDLKSVLESCGTRGYRAVQLEAGITGGKMYLLAYALGLGATGLTFYDDDMTNFFSPHARGKSAIFVTVIGKPARRRSLSLKSS